MNQEENDITKLGCVNHDCDVCKAKRQWVGLTDEDKNAITWGNDIYKILELAEAKLKEKNT
jgi:hypothetical protein